MTTLSQSPELQGWALILGASSGFGEAASLPWRKPGCTSSAYTWIARQPCRTSSESSPRSNTEGEKRFL